MSSRFINGDLVLDSSFYETGTINLASSGNFTAGEIRYVRVGKLVTISMTSTFTFASSASPASASGALPASIRPSIDTTNLYYTDSSSSGLWRLTIQASGALSFTLTNNAGTAGAARTSLTVMGSISYTVA